MVWEAGRLLAWPVTVASGGMAERLLPGDHMLVDRLCYRLRPVALGDVVAFRAAWPLHPIWVLRVAGLPGDEVEIRGDTAFRNGQALPEPWLKRQGELPEELQSFGPATVPEGTLFLLGDNRRAANDSRILGFVPLDDVLGRVQVVAWSNEPRRESWHGHGREVPGRFGAVRWGRLGLRVAE